MLSRSAFLNPASLTVGTRGVSRRTSSKAALSAASPTWAKRFCTKAKVSSGWSWMKAAASAIACAILVQIDACSAQYCAEHASICTKMAHAMADSAVFIQDHPDETFAFVKKRFAQVGDAALKAAFDEVRRDTPRVPAVSEAGFKNADRLNIEAGLMKPDDQVQSYDGLFTDKYLK